MKCIRGMKSSVATLAALAPLIGAPAQAADLVAPQPAASGVEIADPAYDRFFIMPNLSTLGAGVELGYRIDPSWQVRGGINGLAGSFVYRDKDSDLHNKVRLLNGGVKVDWFPYSGALKWGGEVYLTGGLLLSANRIQGRVKNLHGKLKSGSNVFVPNPLTTYEVTHNAIQPYIGAGYSWKVKENISLNFDLGAAYAGKPDLAVDSRAHKLGFSRRDIRREIERANNRLSPFRVYPVVQVGLKFDF